MFIDSTTSVLPMLACRVRSEVMHVWTELGCPLRPRQLPSVPKLPLVSGLVSGLHRNEGAMTTEVRIVVLMIAVD